MKHEKGNALWFILIAISLLALLTVMLSRGSSNTNETGSYERNVITANEIFSFAKSIDNAINGLMAKGCSENEISLQADWNNNGTITDTAGDAYNATSPVDKSCHLFHIAGSGLHFNQDIAGFRFTVSGFHRINALGCNNASLFCTEIIFALKDIPKNICEAINRELNLPINPILFDTNGADGFPIITGTFPSAGGTRIGEADARLSGEHSACYLDNDDDVMIFYHVILVR